MRTGSADWKSPEARVSALFCISVLLRNPGTGHFPQPLRIADKWMTTKSSSGRSLAESTSGSPSWMT